MRRWDVVVVGAGPAGAVVARETARRGSTVLLLDRASLPRWKVCGGCLSAGALSVLEDLGLDHVVWRLGAVPLRALALRQGTRSALLRLRGSVSLSRMAFDFALVREAAAAGSECWAESRVSLGATRADGRIVRVHRQGTESEILAGVVVDATGLGRGLAEGVVDPPSRPAEGSRVGLGATFEAGRYPVREGILHMAVGRFGYVGLVRDERGNLNVAAAVDPGALRVSPADQVVADILQECGLPPIEDRPELGWRGTPALTRTAVLGAERLFRLGDAGGYVEPFTGEGMCWALAGARAVSVFAHAGARAWREELLSAWRRHYRRRMAGSQRLCRGLAAGLRRPRLVAAAVTALRVAPGLAAPFVRRAASAPRALQVSGA